MARYCIACCHLTGLVIRRVGFVHSEKMRPAAIAALKVFQDGGSAKERCLAASKALGLGREEDDLANKAAWQENLDATDLDVWLQIVRRMASDLEIHASSSPSTSHMQRQRWNPDLYQLDSLVLYAAATSQYSRGAQQLYHLLGHPCPASAPLVLSLDAAAKHLSDCIEQCRRALTMADEPALADEVATQDE